MAQPTGSNRNQGNINIINQQPPGESSRMDAAARGLASAARAVGSTANAMRTAGSVGYGLAQGVKNHIKSNNWGYVIIFTLLYYLARTFYPVVTWGDILIANLMIFILVKILLGEDMRAGSETFKSGLVVFAVASLVPLLVYITPSIHSNAFITLYLLNPAVAMWWTYWAILKSPDQGIICWLFKRLLLFYIVGLSLSFVFNAGYFEEMRFQVSDEMRHYGWQLYVKSYENVAKTAGGAYSGTKTAISTWWNLRIREATGDYYTGKVEQNQQEQLGVYLTNVKPSDTQFYAGQPITVWATLKVKSMGDEVNINNFCFTGEKRPDGSYSGTQGSVYPIEIKRAYGPEQHDLECKFVSDTQLFDIPLAAGTHQVTVESSFNFQTMAYIKRYFMDKESYRAMNRQGIDPFSLYKITDKAPSAIYTNGPVALGMKRTDDNPLVLVDPKEETKVRVGLTIEKNPTWKGGIKEIRQVIIGVPDSLFLENKETDCNYPFKEYTQDECAKDHETYQTKELKECKEKGKTGCAEDLCKREFEGYRLYALDVQGSATLKNIEQYKTFSCWFKVENPAGILGDTPIATRYFRGTARYTYNVEEKGAVVVKDDPAMIDWQNMYTQRQTQLPKDSAAGIQAVYGTYRKSLEEYNILGAQVFSPCAMAALIMMESGNNPYVKNKYSSSTGLLQFTKGTAEAYGLCTPGCVIDKRTDPVESIKAGYAYLGAIYSKLGDLIAKEDSEKFLITGFHLGEGCVKTILTKTGKTSNIDWLTFRNHLTVSNLLGAGCYPKQTSTWASEHIKITDSRIDKLSRYVSTCRQDSELIKKIESTSFSEKTPSIITKTQTVKKGETIDLDSSHGIKITVDSISTPIAGETAFFPDSITFTATDTLLKTTISASAQMNEEKRLMPMLSVKPLKFKPGSTLDDNSADIEIKAYAEFAHEQKSMQKDSQVYIGAGLNGIFTGSSIVIRNINNEVICTIPWGPNALTANCGQNMPGVLWAANIAYTTNWHDLGIAQARIFYKPKQRQSTTTYTDKEYDSWSETTIEETGYTGSPQDLLDDVGVSTPLN